VAPASAPRSIIPSADRGLTSLLAPIVRVTGYDTVIPLPRLESHYMPSAARIAAAARHS
jgi:pyruvate dehydrogenase E1 component beta subunit